MNLCTNARQAIGEEHGTISLSLREVSLDDHVVVEGKQAAMTGQTYLEVTIKDTGCGIDEESLANIYDPFFTTKQKDQGTGLGLAVVHGIVKKHNGEIHVDSVQGEGTSFSIYLRADGREVETERVDTGNPGRSHGNERILVVDDEAAIAEVLARTLKRSGYEIVTFNDSMVAVQYFRDNPDCCDLIITDMLMSKMTGAELAREVLSIRRDLPIIMLTGHSEHFNREKALRMGISEYLLKPVKGETLRSTVKKVLQYG